MGFGVGLIKKGAWGGGGGGYCEDLRAEVWGTKSWGITKYLCRTILYYFTRFSWGNPTHYFPKAQNRLLTAYGSFYPPRLRCHYSHHLLPN